MNIQGTPVGGMLKNVSKDSPEMAQALEGIMSGNMKGVLQGLLEQMAQNGAFLDNSKQLNGGDLCSKDMPAPTQDIGGKIPAPEIPLSR